MRRAVIAALALALVAIPSPAEAYEFWVRARSIGQAYQLRQYQLIGPDLFLGRRRYTQTIALRIVDIGDLSAERRQQRLPDRGLTISWQSYLRVDHDFGTFTSGRMTLSPSIRRDAIDVIPELAESTAGLDLLYGHLTIAGLAGDRVTVQLGRVLFDDGWGGSGVDGTTVRAELPGRLAITALAGLRVRAASPLGHHALELDGTSGAGCQEYVEGPTPGTGSWQLIDRNRRITNSRLSSDFELCPQRQVWQPTAGVALATSRRRGGGIEVGYRRTWSRTVGVFDGVDRLAYPDVGLYPNEHGQAPAHGVNEERLYARAHADLRAGSTVLTPYANARFSLLHAAFDRADLGMRIRRGDHVVEPTFEYFLPTFDGDSIFNAFSIAPTTDVRVGYGYLGSALGRLRLHGSAWLRRYAEAEALPSFAGGVDAGIEHAPSSRLRARADALWDDGYGGRRLGGTGEIAWKARDDLWLRGRAIVLGVREEDAPAYVTSSVVLSSSYQVSEMVALHVVAEGNHDEVSSTQTRVFAVLDLAFAPEP